ncbi:Rossmann-like domain-containing protein [Pararhodospirillum oryzae]|uniref:Heavy-metal chelation domain-containing protein n=1 Tax=Pararhodospirillum oryzae TaxID=478448 RepID=A0A512H6G9_9PROT|nr:DUF364 domain-containing protein [Pararhodospirillum oryzae]GEO81034.1 hypothetical protein ROR02_11650 [Pararhodospirillum oryzae]
MFEPAKAPWIRPGVVLHEPGAPVEDLLGLFSIKLRTRGFRVAGLLARSVDGDTFQTRDLASGRESLDVSREGVEAQACQALRGAMRDDVDLALLCPFGAFDAATRALHAAIEGNSAQGLPLLTALPAADLPRWLDQSREPGAILTPTMRALWQWWGPERLYADLAQGVAQDEVRQIVVGSRWLMVQGPAGTGLAHVSGSSKELIARLPSLRHRSLRQLAELHRSWDPLEMALAVAAINAHYNRTDSDALMGNGAEAFGHEAGRVVVVGAFPGLADAVAHPQVIESNPRPGEYPTTAMDTLLPGCAAAVVASSTLLNRTLPRILRLARGSRVALIGPGAPLTPRLYPYGIEGVGSLIIRDPQGLATAIRAGALPREFTRFGEYRHLLAERPAQRPSCRFRA